MSTLDDLDALCSEQLINRKRQFDVLVLQVNFDLLDGLELDPTSICGNPQVSASTSNSGTCTLQVEPCPPSSRFTLPKSDDGVTAAQAASVPKNTRRTIAWAVNI